MPSPTLVLLPGLDGTGLLFAPLLAALPADVPTQVVPYPADRTVDYADLTTAVADRLPRDGPFVLVGESFGGPLAMMLAARRPTGLVGLVLCATFVTSPRPVLGRLIRPLVGPWPFRFYPAYKRLRQWAGGPAAAGSWAAAAEVTRTVRPDVIAARVRMTMSVDARTALTACPVPVLYLQGRRDWVVPAGNLRRLRRARPDVTTVTIDTSHQLFQRQPAECAAAIKAFARQLSGRP